MIGLCPSTTRFLFACTRLIPDSYIQDLLARLDIVEVVGRYVRLRKGGANLFGLCPFHKEKSPSFTVSPSKQFYYCFGCGEYGSAITFLMKHTGADFVEAVHTLSSTIGMAAFEPKRSMQQHAHVMQRRSSIGRHTQILNCAQALYIKQLRTCPEAISYLKQRGLTGDIAKHFGLGWSGYDRQKLATVFDNYNDPVLLEAGLVIKSEDGRRYDRFRGRIMFPIRNTRGVIIGFGGRIIGSGEPKYLNSPETPVFSKGHELYGLWEGRQAICKEKQIIVVEGYMDVVGLAQLGVRNAVATLGTATTLNHITKLLRVTDKIIFSFDGDMAGRKAAWRALLACLPALRDGISIRFLFLPIEHDPDSYVRAYGETAFLACLAKSDALSRFLLKALADRHNLREAEGRASCLHESKPLIALIPECALRLQIKHELASLVQLTPDELTRLLSQTKRVQRATAQIFLPNDILPGAKEQQPAHLPGARIDSVHSKPISGSFIVDDSTRFGVIADDNGEAPGFSSCRELVGNNDVGVPLHGSTSDLDVWNSRLQSSQTDIQDSAYRAASSKRTLKSNHGKGRWRNDPLHGVIEARCPVPTLARRLLHLLLAHLKLIDSMGDEQLEVIDKDPHLNLVRDLIALAQITGARHISTLLEAAEPTSDLYLLLSSTRTDFMSEEALPDPQAEWDGALQRIEFDTLTAEMHALAAAGLSDEAACLRYHALWRRKSMLKLLGIRNLR